MEKEPKSEGVCKMKSSGRYAKKLNRKRVLICMLLFFALLPVFSYLHEAGHALVCAADGNESEITVGIDDKEYDKFLNLVEKI